MKTCRIASEVIEQLHDNWISFYNKRVDAINYLRGLKLKEINETAQAEIKKGILSKNDVVDWYEKQLEKMREWMDDAKVGLDKAESLFESIYEKLKEKVFTEKDIGKLYIYDFYKSEVRVNKGDKSNVISVKFMMYHWDYNYYPFKVDNIQFIAPEVKFTDWEEVEE